MLTLFVTIKSEMPCETELLQFAGMNDHLHAAGFLEHLKSDAPTPKKIWEAIRTLFAAMNEVQECDFSIRSQDKGRVYNVPGVREHAAYIVICIRYLDPHSGRECVAGVDGSRQSWTGADELETSEVGVGSGMGGGSRALRGFYELADILIVVDEVLSLEISNFARHLKYNPEIGDNHPIISHLTASLWFRGMDLTITRSTSKASGRSNERRNMAAAEMQLESMGYRLTQERGRWPFLTPRLENATNKTQENAPHLVRQIWKFLEGQLEVAESREMTVGRFVTAANEVTIGVFWREHAKDELRTRKNHEILRFLSPCWEKRYMARVFYKKDTILKAFVQELLNMPINLLLALYLVYPRYLFNMGPAYMFTRGVETLQIDGYLTIVLLTHGELVAFHRLMKYGEPLSMGKTHPSTETYSYKCTAGLKRLLVEYLLMQTRYLTGEETYPKTREELKEANGVIPLLTDLCLAMRYDPLGAFRGLGEVVTCIYGPEVTYAFPDPLVAAHRNSVLHVSLISVLDGTALNWYRQEALRAQMSNTVIFGKDKDPELVMLIFREQLQYTTTRCAPDWIKRREKSC